MCKAVIWKAEIFSDNCLLIFKLKKNKQVHPGINYGCNS